MKWSLLCLMVVAALALADPSCPEDGGGAYFTGKTRTSTSGRLLYQYKCMTFGHLFWAAPPRR